MTEKKNYKVERLESLKVKKLAKSSLDELNLTSKTAAFTLAEVLITLGVIGVVAAITMPMLITNINDRANSERHANIAYKMTQAMEQMRAHGKLTAYDSTSAFVDELQKYLKITKRCDADHIAECWPTEKVIDANGDEYNVADCKTRKNLLAGSTSTDENVGLILADGASVILTYDTSAAPMDVGDKVLASKKSLPVGKNKTKEFAYTMNVAAPIDFVTDVNGKKGPNSETRNNEYNDIRNFSAAQFSTGCTGERGSQGCVKIAAVALNWTLINCSSSNSENTDYQNYCGSTPSGYNSEYWAGAKKKCAEAGMQLPNVHTLQDICNAWKRNNQYQTELASAGSYWFWSSTESSSERQQAQYVQFNRNCNIWSAHKNYGGGSSQGLGAVLCVN